MLRRENARGRPSRVQKNLRRSTPARLRIPEPKSMIVLGSVTQPPAGPQVVIVVVVVLVVLPRTVNDSDGMLPTEFSEAMDGPEFSSQ